MYRVNLIPDEYARPGGSRPVGLKKAVGASALVFLLLILLYVYFLSAAAGYRMDAAAYRRNAGEPAPSTSVMERLQKERQIYDARNQLVGAISRKEFLLAEPAQNVFKAVPAGLALTCLEIKKSGAVELGPGLKSGDDPSKPAFNENLLITGEAASLEVLGAYLSNIQELEIFQPLTICEASWEKGRYKFKLGAVFKNGGQADATESGNND